MEAVVVVVACDGLQHQVAARSQRGGVDAVHMGQASHGLRRCRHISRAREHLPIGP